MVNISTSIVTEEQANKCKYSVSGSVRFRREQISAATDSIPGQWQPDRITISLFQTPWFIRM